MTFGTVPAATSTVRAGSSTRSPVPSAARRVNAIALTCAELVGNRLDRIEVLGEDDALLERLADFLVIQPIGGRVLHPLAIGERHAAPLPHERDEIGRFAGRRGARALGADGAAVPRNSSRMPCSSGSSRLAHRGSPISLHERFVAIEDLLDLQRVIGEQLGRRIDAGQPAADHHRRQPHLQVRQRVVLERAGQLQRHQEVAGLADAANQVVLDVDDRRPAGAGGDGHVIDAVRPRFFERSARRRSGCRRRCAASRAARASGGSA